MLTWSFPGPLPLKNVVSGYCCSQAIKLLLCKIVKNDPNYYQESQILVFFFFNSVAIIFSEIFYWLVGSVKKVQFHGNKSAMYFRIFFYTTVTKTATKFWALQESMSLGFTGELVFTVSLLMFEQQRIENLTLMVLLVS